jgi:hypothetical protein
MPNSEENILYTLADIEKLSNSSNRAVKLINLIPELTTPNSLSQALRIVAGISNSATCLTALSKLIPHLSYDQILEALKIACNITLPESRSKALTQLSSLLIPDSPQEAIKVARELVSTRSYYACAEFLVVNLPQTYPELLKDIFKIACEIDDCRDNENRIDALTKLNNNLEKVPNAIDRAGANEEIDRRFCSSQRARAKVLMLLYYYLDGEQQSLVFEKLLETIEEIPAQPCRARSLMVMAPYLPENLASRVAERAFIIVKEIIEDIRKSHKDSDNSWLEQIDFLTFQVEIQLHTLPLSTLLSETLSLQRRVEEFLFKYLEWWQPKMIEGVPPATISSSPNLPIDDLIRNNSVSIDEAEVGTARYLNLGITQNLPGPNRNLPLHEGLRPGYRYILTAGLGLKPDLRFRETVGQPLMYYPDESQEFLELQVALFVRGRTLKILGAPLASLSWPRQGPSTKNAEFTLLVEKTDVKETGLVRLMIYYKTNLLYTADLQIEVVPEEHDWQEDENYITWAYEPDEDKKRSLLFKHFSHINRLSERALNLAIQSDGTDQYQITAFMGRAELPAIVKLTRVVLTDFVLRTREKLDDLRRNSVYIEGGFNQDGIYEGDLLGNSVYNAMHKPMVRKECQDTFSKFLDEMAQLGSEFWDRLFSDESGQILRKAISEHLHEDDIIQIWIDANATDFVFPWAWLYSESSLDPSKRVAVKKENFWGYKYVIEQLPQYPETTRHEIFDEIKVDKELRVKVGVRTFVKTTAMQRLFFTNYVHQSGGELHAEIWDQDEQWEEFLPKCDSQILYFFSHGHTAKPKTEASLKVDDMLAKWRTWVNEPVQGESKYLRCYRMRAAKLLREEEPDLDRTYIKLNEGYLLLTELNNLMNLKQVNPLVFLNMCESAQIFPDISEGLIDVFLKKGARAVIGTEMPMLPHFADLFSRRFFEAFLTAPADEDTNGDRNKTASVGFILYKLRREFLNKGNPLGFAYTLFGSAMTRLDTPLPNHSHDVPIPLKS